MHVHKFHGILRYKNVPLFLQYVKDLKQLHSLIYVFSLVPYFLEKATPSPLLQR